MWRKHVLHSFYHVNKAAKYDKHSREESYLNLRNKLYFNINKSMVTVNMFSTPYVELF